MATTFAAKPAGAAYSYTWNAPIVDGDALASVTVTATGATVVEYSLDGGAFTFLLSGGTEGETASIAVSATTDLGETLVDTLYIPINPTTAFGATVRDICGFALRKINGLGVDADAASEADAIERLRDMLAMWRDTGADIGAPALMDANTVIFCRDAYLSAIKNNLILQLADLYEVEPTPMVVENARRGLQAIKQANLPDDRGAVSFF